MTRFGYRPVAARLLPLLLLVVLLPIHSGCERTHEVSLEQIREQGEIIVLTRNAPTTYYEGREGMTGLEYDLVTAFARHLEVAARFKVYDGTADILAALRGPAGHLAAAGLTRTEARREHFLFGPSYQSVKQQVVCRRGGKRPKTVKALAGVQLQVAADSSYVERLEELKQKHSALEWQVSNDLGSEQLLEKVWRRQLECTVADSNIVAINRRYFPELSVMFDLTQAQELAWAFPAQADELRGAVEKWFRTFKKSGKLDALLAKHYGFIELFDYVDTRVYIDRIKKVLPRYRKTFKQAAARYRHSWTLLAAQAYQESHWNPTARSPTGVRGMMMLTQTTAAELGVTDRLDVEQSIMGGAKYLDRQRERLPPEIQGKHRRWIALAAYNVGMGHIHDARELARRFNKNPNLWHDLAEVLPLLSRKEYYRTLKHGYARGGEPVRYVNRIRHYRDILEQRLR